MLKSKITPNINKSIAGHRLFIGKSSKCIYMRSRNLRYMIQLSGPDISYMINIEGQDEPIILAAFEPWYGSIELSED